MDLAEEFIKYCVQWALDNCKDDLQFLNDMFDKGLIARLQDVLKESFVRLPYTEGIKILEEAVAKGHKFEFPVYWGVDLAAEHERFLVEDHFKRPVILTDYPKKIKAFYMKQNEDGKTVRAMAFEKRRKRDSNPRNPLGVYTLSRRASSTTRASLRSRPLPSSLKRAQNTKYFCT